MDVRIGTRRIRLEPSQAIGKGGEADIYNIGGGDALKLFKQPDHPDFEGVPHEQQGARNRIAEHQRKLRQFPRGLHANVVTPKELATTIDGSQIVGYTLQFITPAELLLSYSKRVFREAGVVDRTVVEIFRSLHAVVRSLHDKQVVIGDFNDLNVLVRGTECFLLDADSAQFGEFYCRVFTSTFVDPLLCDPSASAPLLVKPHTALSDWYAYVIMFMQSLLYVGPYGGVYKPTDKSARIPHDARSLHRISVFHPEVRYPRPARPLGTLPDAILDYFQEIFVRDRREPFPDGLFEKLQFDASGNLLAVLKEPVAPVRVREVVTGTVSAKKLFSTTGRILYSTVQGGVIQYLYFEQGEYRRENGSVVSSGALDPHMRYRISGSKTIVAKGSKAIVFSPGASPDQLTVETYGQLPLVDANEQAVLYVQNGELRRSGALGVKYSERIGDVLSNQTLFWTGEKLGFGFYRAGGLCRYFLFGPQGHSINDSVQLPPIRGQLIDSVSAFGHRKVWFFLSVREGGITTNRCYLINEQGKMIAAAEAQSGEDNWLGTVRGKCAVGDMLLAATDDGVVRVEAVGTNLQVVKAFPDTAQFVDSETNLLVTKDGLVAVRRSQEIWNLQIK